MAYADDINALQNDLLALSQAQVVSMQPMINALQALAVKVSSGAAIAPTDLSDLYNQINSLGSSVQNISPAMQQLQADMAQAQADASTPQQIGDVRSIQSDVSGLVAVTNGLGVQQLQTDFTTISNKVTQGQSVTPADVNAVSTDVNQLQAQLQSMTSLFGQLETDIKQAQADLNASGPTGPGPGPVLPPSGPTGPGSPVTPPGGPTGPFSPPFGGYGPPYIPPATPVSQQQVSQPSANDWIVPTVAVVGIAALVGLAYFMYRRDQHNVKENPALRVSYADYRASIANQLMNKYGWPYAIAVQSLDMRVEGAESLAEYLYNDGVPVSKAARMIHQQLEAAKQRSIGA